MVHWAWLIVAFIGGGIVIGGLGFICVACALLSDTNTEEDYRYSR
jgi:hypothetical protein